MASRGYVSLSVLILRILRARRALGSGTTIEDIIAGLGPRQPDWIVETWVDVSHPYWEPVWWARLDRRDARPVIRRCLEEFGELGLVRHETDDNGDEGHRWHLAPDWLDRGDTGGDAGGDGDGYYGEPPRPDGEAPGDDGPGSGGLGEVLAHPRLFALAADDLDEAVLRALGGER